MKSDNLLSNEKSADFQSNVTDLISKHKNIVFSAAKAFSNSADYEELVSDGFEALLRAAAGYTKERAAFSTYASACIRNAMLNTIKRTQRRVDAIEDNSQDLESIIDPAPSPEEVFIGKETNSELFRKAEEVLTEIEMKCIDGVIFGLSYNEIAEKLGVEKKVVDNALLRARTKLRKLISK